MAITVRQFDNTTFRLAVTESDAPLDLSSALAGRLCFLKPSGSVIGADADIIDDSPDWKLVAQADDDLLDEIGDWEIQGHFTLPDGEYSTEAVVFSVQRRLCS